jgi:hypothetical protein
MKVSYHRSAIHSFSAPPHGLRIFSYLGKETFRAGGACRNAIKQRNFLTSTRDLSQHLLGFRSPLLYPLIQVESLTCIYGADNPLAQYHSFIMVVYLYTFHTAVISTSYSIC